MVKDAPEALAFQLSEQARIIESWRPCEPDPSAVRCEGSRHRTLAHLRACQEQWLIALSAFAQLEGPSVKFLHPWRHFEIHRYESVPWELHMEKFTSDRIAWLQLFEGVDTDRGGSWNRKPDTIGGLTVRLLAHEAGHIQALEGFPVRSYRVRCSR